MARAKKNEGTPPPPKDHRDVKHGCCSCKHYRLDVKAFPCRDCEKWNYWEDSEPNTKVFDPAKTISQPESAVNVPVVSFSEPERIDSKPEQPVAQPKKRGKKAKQTPSEPEESMAKPEVPESSPKKSTRSGRPKKQTIPSDIDQVSFLLD